MKQLNTFSIFTFILFYVILEGCDSDQIESRDIKHFAISNIQNLVNWRGENLKKSYDTYLTKFTLTNLSHDTFTIVARGTILPQHSLGWNRGDKNMHLNYEHYGSPEKRRAVKYFPMDSIELTMKNTATYLLDSFMYRPELVLNNRRYRLEYMFRQNDEGTGYYLKDSISSAVMLEDTIADYSNYNIGIE